MFALWEVPGAHEIDAGVVAAADAVQGEGEPVEGLLDGVFVVRADVGGAGFGEGDAIGVGEEGCEVMVVLRWSGWWWREFEEAAREGRDYCIGVYWTLREIAMGW